MAMNQERNQEMSEDRETSPNQDRTVPTPATQDAEGDEAAWAHVADRGPTPDEERAAEEAVESLESEGRRGSVAEHYEQMTDIGAHVSGEGEID